MLGTYNVNQSTDNGNVLIPNTLSWAIDRANDPANPGQHTINITAAEVTVNGRPPNITAPAVIIDGNPSGPPGHRAKIRKDPNSISQFGPIWYDGDDGGAGQLVIRDLEISGFQTSGIRIDSLNASDIVQINNVVLHDNDGSGIWFAEMPTGNGFLSVVGSYFYGNGSGIVFGNETGQPATTGSSFMTNNWFGQRPDGTIDANTDYGVRFRIGAGNVSVSNDNRFIAHGSGGVLMESSAGDRVRISNNIFGDSDDDPSELITLVPSGSSGPNNLLNKPELRADLTSLSNNQWQFKWDVDFGSNGAGEYRFEFYRRSAVTNQWSHVAISTKEVGTTATQLTQTFAGGLFSAGDTIAAIAIGNSGTNLNNTSEFSESIVLDAAPPRISNVVMRGSGFQHSFDSIVSAGQQLVPLTSAGVNAIDIYFSEDVDVGASGSELTLLASQLQSVAGITFAGFNPVTNVATWTLSSPLAADKYALRLSSATIVDDAGKALDGEWDRPIAPSDKTTQPDNNGRPAESFPTGSDNTQGGDFRFHFAVLPTGSSAVLTATRRSGDYDDNEYVDGSDYEVWKMSFGSTMDLWADGNNNGVVDAADYTIWRNNLGGLSAWSAGADGGGGGGPIVQFGVAPMVANVVISGSNSVHDPYSFDAVDGSGEQLRTVPVGGADTISITFSEDVNVVASDLTLVGLRSASRPTLAEFSYDLGTMTATWRFENWNVADHYVISLDDAVTDVEGNALDGEWTNPVSLSTTNVAVSEFPSGNGTAGGDFNFVMTLLPPDANRDLVLDGTDLYILRMHYGMSGVVFTDGDFSGDGLVTYDEYLIFYEHYECDLRGPLQMLADLNGDWVVDDADGDILYNNWYTQLPNPTQADGDLDGDGDIDVNDLDLMFAQYGRSLSVVS